MIVDADAAYRLEALGLRETRSPLVLQAFCQRCDQLLHERMYRPDEPLPADWDVAVEATADALVALDHGCRQDPCPC